jgi:hypothetical protein
MTKGFFNPEPTPKAFGAALPIELPTRKFQFPVAKEIFNPEPTPKAFGAALPIELRTRAGLHFLMPAVFFNVQ